MIKIKTKKKPLGAVILLMNKLGDILILRRAPESYFAPNQWGFPGGKIEEGETACGAALRETLEETELRVYSPQPLGVFNNAVEAFFSNEFEGSVKIDFEHTDWKWVSPDDLVTYDLAPSVHEIYNAARKTE